MHSATTVSLAVNLWSEDVWTPTTIGAAPVADRVSNITVDDVAIMQKGELDAMETETDSDVVYPRASLYSYKPVSAIVPNP